MRKTPVNKSSLTSKANAAMHDAVAKVIEDQSQSATCSLAVWQDGKVCHIRLLDQVSTVHESPPSTAHGSKFRSSHLQSRPANEGTPPLPVPPSYRVSRRRCPR